MRRILLIIRQYTLPIAMLIGAACYRWLGVLSFLTPYLIFTMLFLTYLKVDIRQMRLKSWHWFLLVFQIIAAVSTYYLILPFDKILAQGLMLCFIMPTATAAAVITGKLGGSVEQQTTYTLLSSFCIALFVPVFFPFINSGSVASLTILLPQFTLIISRIFPLLIFPFLLAIAIRYMVRKGTGHDLQMPHWLSGMPFYLWAFSLVILIANTVHSLVYDDYNHLTALWLSIGALAVCAIQFAVGKFIGKRYDATISAGQALGQKNTILGIWMGHTYLLPISSLAVAAYIVCQNLYNAYQLKQVTHGDKVRHEE